MIATVISVAITPPQMTIRGATATINHSPPAVPIDARARNMAPASTIETVAGSRIRISSMAARAAISRVGGSVVRGGVGLVGHSWQLERGRAEPRRAVGARARGGSEDADEAVVADPRRRPEDRPVAQEAPVADLDRRHQQPPAAGFGAGEDDVVGGEAALAEARQAVESDDGRDLGPLADRDAGKPQPWACVEARVDRERVPRAWPMSDSPNHSAQPTDPSSRCQPGLTSGETARNMSAISIA